MKKLMIFLIISLFLMPFCIFENKLYCNAQNSSIYAKVESNNIFLYSSPKKEDSSKMFELSTSYFVRLLENAGDDFYYCCYKDVYGYVIKDEVVAMDGVPILPFVEANFRVYAPEGLGLYSSPLLSDSLKKTTIPYLTDNLTYYGIIKGQEAIPDKSNSWIYCKYNFDTSAYGYVYSVFCDKLPSITTNNERFNIIEKPFVNLSYPKELTSVAMGFIIVGVSLPCLIVLYLLVKPSMIKEKSTATKSKMRATRKRDYFEFDDGDLT